MDFTRYFTDFGSLLIFLLVLNGLVFVHELGHFLACRFSHVPVEEFGLGFPPRLLAVTRDQSGRLRLILPEPLQQLLGTPSAQPNSLRHWLVGWLVPSPATTTTPADNKAVPSTSTHTVYSLNLLPIGGFVRPAGEDNATVANGLANAPKRVRFLVMAAGPVSNLIFAFLIFVVGFSLGWPDQVTIASIAPDSPATQIGLRIGDIIVQANGVTIHYPDQLSEISYGNVGRPVTLVIKRREARQTLTLTPRVKWPEGQGPMGLTMSWGTIVTYPVPQAIVRAGEEIYYQLLTLVRLPGRLIRNQISYEEARLCGPVCMNELTRAAVEVSQEVNALYPLLQLIGLISIALGVTNLLPIPAMDGGRIVFVLLEAIRGKRLSPEREGLVHMVGLFLLLALMVYVTYQDIVNPNPLIPR